MVTKLRAHLRSNVIGYLALFVALGGAAYALPGKGVIDKNDLRKNVVSSKNIKANAATGADVSEGTLNFSCPTGKTEAAAACWDSSDRAADDWQAAAVDCAGEGGFLPSFTQYLAADPVLGLTVATPDLWTDQRYTDGGPSVAAALLYEAGTQSPQPDDATDARQYRCAYSLIRQ
jgi:hypothetical protein